MDIADMKKTNELSKMLVSELIPKRIVDNNAQTCEEIALASNISATTAQRKMNQFVKQGKVQKVWKQKGSCLVPAYRMI